MAEARNVSASVFRSGPTQIVPADEVAQIEIRLAVVVLNWNNAPDTIECLQSVRRHAPRVTTVVVDNASTDGGDRTIVESGLADAFLRNAANLGFAAGNNVGLHRALELGASIIMVLNNDTVITAGMFERLEATLGEESQRVVSPRIVYHEEPDVAWFAGGIFDHGWPRHLQPAELDADLPTVRPSEFLTGCCLMARREVWLNAGLFDEDYFLIFEDNDWSLRARQVGAALLVDDGAVVRHKVSRSFREGSAAMLGSYYFGRNGVIFLIRWQRPYAWHFLVCHVVLPLVRSIRSGGGRRSSVFALIGALTAFLGSRGPAGPRLTRLATLVS